jgi:hypothetical protein
MKIAWRTCPVRSLGSGLAIVHRVHPWSDSICPVHGVGKGKHGIIQQTGEMKPPTWVQRWRVGRASEAAT